MEWEAGSLEVEEKATVFAARCAAGGVGERGSAARCAGGGVGERGAAA